MRHLVHLLEYRKRIQQTDFKTILEKLFPGFPRLADNREALKNLISKVYSAHVFLIGTLCWRAWYWFTWASLRASQNCSWSSCAFWRMNGGDQIHWMFIIPSHGNKTSMASPDVMSTIHPLFHRRGDDNVLGKPSSICPYGSTSKYFFGFKLQRKMRVTLKIVHI